jgi:hypothetical protein
MKKQFVIFRCETDNCWVVAATNPSLKNPDVFFGVAECPDEQTSKVVLAALRLREKTKK